MSEVKLYLVLNAFVVRSAEWQVLYRTLRNKGTRTVWFYAPGYLNPDGTAGDIHALTGLPLQPLPNDPTLENRDTKIRIPVGAASHG